MVDENGHRLFPETTTMLILRKDARMMRKMPHTWKRSFPVTSPIFEVRQFRKSSQKMVDTLEAGTLVRFSAQGVNGARGGDAHALYAIPFVIERLEGGDWVKCSRTLGQGDLAKRILIVPDEDGDDPTIFAAFDSYDKPLMVLVPTQTR